VLSGSVGASCLIALFTSGFGNGGLLGGDRPAALGFRSYNVGAACCTLNRVADPWPVGIVEPSEES
jgi:hypothetical protein